MATYELTLGETPSNRLLCTGIGDKDLEMSRAAYRPLRLKVWSPCKGSIVSGETSTLADVLLKVTTVSDVKVVQTDVLKVRNPYMETPPEILANVDISSLTSKVTLSDGSCVAKLPEPKSITVNINGTHLVLPENICKLLHSLWTTPQSDVNCYIFVGYFLSFVNRRALNNVIWQEGTPIPRWTPVELLDEKKTQVHVAISLGKFGDTTYLLSKMGLAAVYTIATLNELKATYPSIAVVKIGQPVEGCDYMKCENHNKAMSKVFVCSRCHTAQYCGKVCQQADWSQHKVACAASRKKCETTRTHVKQMGQRINEIVTAITTAV